MKVFVGFGYNPNDAWVNQLIIPLIEALGCEVVTGEEMQGEKLSDGVIARIEDSDACIGFLTKREGPDSRGFYSTHKWVIEEIAVALAKKKSIFVLREKGVDPQNGITGDTQWYEFEDKAALMLEIAKFIGKEKSQMSFKTFMLLPEEFSESIKPHVKFAKCTYKFLHNAKEYVAEEAKLIRVQGGYSIFVKKIPSEHSQIQITVESPGGTWSSSFISVGLMNVNLQKDN